MNDADMLPFLCEDSNHEGFVKPECFMNCKMSYYQSNSFYQKV